MAKIDLEVIADDLVTILKAELNGKLTAIDTEKGDGITLKQIAAEAYYFQDLNGTTINHNPYVFYAISDILGDGGLQRAPIRAEIFIAVVIEDDGEDVSTSRRLFRYQRAMREVIQSKFDSLSSGVKLSMKSQVPIEITLVNSTHRHRAAGITVTADLG